MTSTLKSKKKEKPVVVKKKHRHLWAEHCDCEYCTLESCVTCGEEREMKPVKKL